MTSSFDILDKLISLEKRHKLLINTSDSLLYYWDCIRYEVFYQLLIDKKVFRPSSSTIQTKSIKKRVNFFFHLLINEINFMLFAKHRDYLFYTSSRNKNKEQVSFDSVLESIKQNSSCYYSIESFDNANYPLNNKYKDRYFLYSLTLFKKLIKKDKKDFRWLSKLINSEFNLNRDWSLFINNKLNEVKAEKIFYRRILKKIKPKVVFFNRNGSLQALIYEAHAANIPVVELQHGSITPASLFYNYPNNIDCGQLKSIPDWLFTFSSYWNKKVTPLIKTIDIGNDYFVPDQVAASAKNKFITVVSGKFVYEKLLEFTLNMAGNLTAYTIYFKLHPGEAAHVEDAKIKTKEHNNIVVVYDEESVEELIKISTAVLLVQSTCSYVSLQLGVSLFILKVHYYEESKDIFDLPNVYLIDSCQEFLACIQGLDNVASNTPEFFMPFNKEKFHSFMQQLLN